ncbi:MAG: class I SAM-dependent methyltransferase [Acidobacteriaceae bacterium]|nr:class I SAM-dependent methyltransferase [Acidobacteriaceae bacterium]
MPFVPALKEWVESHVIQVPNELIRFCVDITGKGILDVGCGDMLSDFGLLARGPRKIIGLDVHRHPKDILGRTAATIRDAGLELPAAYETRLEYVQYEGNVFPFPDNSFDLVYSWSAFEHIPDVPKALSEIRRVVKPDGRVFIQVYPWFPSFWGSHLTDYIDEPFFHLSRPDAWVHERLTEYCAAHPEKRDFILGHMWGEYRTLNKHSAKRFISSVLAVGFCIDKLESILRLDYLDKIPPDTAKADVISAGTLVYLLPAK